ncbi:MAG: hypothetical protein AAF513_10595 [Pseudomonadota bacterium]
MSIQYHINTDDGLVTIKASDKLEVSEIIACGEALLRDAEFDPRFPQLLDFRGAGVIRGQSTQGAFRQFVLDRYRPALGASMAVVVDDALDHRKLASIYLLVCNLPDTELFEQYEHALKWLLRKEFVPQDNWCEAANYADNSW